MKNDWVRKGKVSEEFSTLVNPGRPIPAAAMQGAMPDTVCPRCGSLLIKRKGRFGEFWGCSAYPGCRYTRNA